MKIDAFSFMVFGVSLIALVLVLTEPYSMKKELSEEIPHSTSEDVIKEEEVKKIDVLDEDQTEIAYKIGYKRGYDNFMKTSVDSKNDDSAVEYTSNKEKDKDKIDLESEVVQEIIMKGYVDGYHKAGESLHCPRNNY